MMGGDLKRVDDALRMDNMRCVPQPKHRGAPLHRRRLHNNFVSSNPSTPRSDSAAQFAQLPSPVGAAETPRSPRPDSGRPKSSRPNSARPATARGWTPHDFSTPRFDMVSSPYVTASTASRKEPVAQELQQELHMTGSVLRAVKDRLKEEREQRVMARAAEELALMDVKLARDAAAEAEERRHESDRKLAKSMATERKELESELLRVGTEHEKVSDRRLR